MNFDDLKDQAREQFSNLIGEIQDNHTFQSIREQYETLSSRNQSLIVYAAIALGAFILISIPYSYFSTSSENVAEFEETRQVLRNLLQAGKADSGTPSINNNISIAAVRDQVVRTVGRQNLLPEQVGEIKPNTAPRESLAKPPIKEESLAVKLKTLNLTQVINIGFELQKLLPNVKMTGMQMNASTSNKDYFDVEFTLSKFNLPMPSSDEKGKSSKRRRKKSK